MSITDIAIQFLTFTALGKSEEAFNNYVSSDFIHHNQYFEGTRDALLKAIQEDFATNPNISIDVKHSYVDGNSVITNSHVVKENMEIAVIHIFKFEGNKIVELWDLGQVIEKNSPNKNGLF